MPPRKTILKGLEDISTGSVIRYPYLWSHQAAKGETEGRKKRPVAVGIRLKQAKGPDLLLLLPITSKQPEPGRFSVEIPEIERRRAGLHKDHRLWIILDDYNADVITGSYFIEPDPVIGSLSKAFFLPYMRAFVARKNQAKGVNRR
jgi:hypothetical protein